MRSVFIIAVLLGMMLAACGGTVDSYDPRTPAFRSSSLTITAVPAELMADSLVAIRTEGIALVSGKGRIGIRVYHTIRDGAMYVESPLSDTITYERAKDSVPHFLWHQTEFVADRPFVLPWRIRVNRLGLYRIDTFITLDSVRASDATTYIGILDSAAIAESPGGHGYDWRMDYESLYLGKQR